MSRPILRLSTPPDKIAALRSIAALDPAKAAARESAAAAARQAAEKAEAEAKAAAAKVEEEARKAAAEAKARRAAKDATDKAIAACFKDLRKRYPAVMNLSAPKPLAVGTTRVVVRGELGYPQKIAGIVMSTWTGRPAYLEALIAGGKRYNLDGSEAGEITEADIADARIRLAAKLAKHAEREAAKAAHGRGSGAYSLPVVMRCRSPART